MPDRFFPAGRVLERLRSSDLGVGLDDLAGYLVRRGHSFEVVQEYVRAAANRLRYQTTDRLLASSTGSDYPDSLCA